MCIIWCLLAHKYYETINNNHKSDVSTYKKYFDEIKQPKDIIYPIDIQKDISKFEKLNNIKRNVFEYDGSYACDYDRNNITLYNTNNKNENVINLLLLKEDDKEHLIWIKDIGKLLISDIHKHNKRYWCNQCLCVSYETKEKLDEHLNLCMNNESVRAILPTKDKVDKYGNREDILKFKNYCNSFLHPFSVFLDFESTLINKQKENIILEENKQNEEEEEINM